METETHCHVERPFPFSFFSFSVLIFIGLYPRKPMSTEWLELDDCKPRTDSSTGRRETKRERGETKKGRR